MTKTEIQDLLKLGLGKRTGTNLDTAIDLYVDMTEDSLEGGGGDYYWFQLAEDNDTLASETTTESVPSDFLAFYEDDGIRIHSATGTLEAILSERPFDELELGKGSFGDDERYFELVNGTINYYPAVASGKIRKYHYYAARAKKFSDLGGSESNIWTTNAADLLVGSAGVMIANNVVKDAQAASGFAAMLASAQARLNKHNTFRQTARTDYSEEPA